MDELEDFKQTFFQECQELLADLEGHLTALGSGEADDEVLHAAFRAIHSIKGGAGAFGFAQLVAFAHVFENVLDLLRSHKLAPDDATLAVLVRANDVLADLVTMAQDGAPPPRGFGEDVRHELHRLTGTEPAEEPGENDAFDFTPVSVHEEAPPDEARVDTAALRPLTIRFAPDAELFRRANDPLLLIRELKKLGTLSTHVDAGRLPSLEEMQPDGGYLKWTFELLTEAPIQAVEEVFEFVADDCVLSIDEPATPSALAPEAVEPPAQAVAEVYKAAPPATPKQDRGAVPKAPPAAKNATIRVDLEKVDRLVNMVGELVIMQAMLSQQADQLSADQHADLLNGLETLALRCRELQETVMAIRAQPVKSVFSRMSRLVRDLSAGLGKEARLVVTGEETEVDKTVVEELAEPLTHMIRNSMDHGMEPPEQRVAAGKPSEGVIRLSAEHRSGRIVISVADDGRGIDRERVLKKSIEKGLVPADARPSDEEIDNMIFLPGFSTADQISDVSGRGVGMDVVRRKIQHIGGRVGIVSNPGQGSCFTLTLPLTLAVLDGMVVRVGAENYVLPITGIVESLKPDRKALHRLVGGGEVLAVRGGYIKLAHLHRLFGVANAVDDPSRGLVVVVEAEDGTHVGLVVDELLGQQQVVIKSLEANYRRIEGVSGATILGNGMVALILDVDGLRSMAHRAPDETLSSGDRSRHLQECCQ